MRQVDVKTWRNAPATAGWSHAGSPWITLLIFGLALILLRLVMQDEPAAEAPRADRSTAVGKDAGKAPTQAQSQVEEERLGRHAVILHARVVDLEGRPLQDVRVQTGRHAAHSDAEGSFAIPRTSAPLVLSKEGFFERSILAAAISTRGDTSATPSVILIAGARLHGKVTNGKLPVAGAHLFFEQEGRFLEGWTETGGSFVSPLLRAGDLRLEILHPDFQAKRVAIEGLSPGQPREQNFTLQSGTRLVVEVRQANGKPVPNAALWLHLARAPHHRASPSPFLGKERFLGRSNDLGRLSIQRPPGALPWIRARAVGFHELAVPAFGNRTEVTLRSKPFLDAFAVDAESGLPIAVRSAHYEPAVDGSDHAPIVLPSGIRHDGDGRFRIDYPPGDGAFRLVVNGAGSRRGVHLLKEDEARSEKGTPTREPVLIYLRPHRQIQGRVFGPKSVEFPLRVELHIAAREPSSKMSFSQSLSTDATGSFQLAGLDPALRIRLRVQAPGLASFLSTELGVRDLAALESLPVVLHEGRKVLGKAVRKDGSAASHIRVILERRRGHPRTAWTDDQGAFAFENVSPGAHYRLSIQSNGDAPTAPDAGRLSAVSREVAVPHDQDVYYRLQI